MTRSGAVTACPGVGRPPTTSDHVHGRMSPVGVCPCCRRQYALKVWPATGGNQHWVMRHHRGLPKRLDGGCPYQCPDDCDFDCYIPDAHLVNSHSEIRYGEDDDRAVATLGDADE